MPQKNQRLPPVLILCGGKGTRLREETEYRPKPLVEIGGKPILWHIMKGYARHGFTRFVLCLGYKGSMIREYFLNYQYVNSDCTVHLAPKNRRIKIHNSHPEEGWAVTLIDTGENDMTGSRVKQAARYVDTDHFMLTYGDGVSNVDLGRLLKFHLSHGKAATVTGVRPPSRFGELIMQDGRLVKFSEKPQIHEGFISGGFFVFHRRALQYLSDSPDCVLEKEPLERMAKRGDLRVHRHPGFWHCMDTYRDYQVLNQLWERREAPWKTW